MTQNEKDLAWLLMQEGHYMVHSFNAKGKAIYKVMLGKQVPVRYFTETTVRKFSGLLKSDARKRITINLSAVRQLNGNSYLSRLYRNKKTTS